MDHSHANLAVVRDQHEKHRKAQKKRETNVELGMLLRRVLGNLLLLVNDQALFIPVWTVEGATCPRSASIDPRPVAFGGLQTNVDLVRDLQFTHSGQAASSPEHPFLGQKGRYRQALLVLY